MEMEEGYRRGTVLGLTIAEIFILLVFLMLLALMGVNRYWSDKEAKKRWKQALALLQQHFGTHQVRGTSWKDRHKEPVNVPVSNRRADP